MTRQKLTKTLVMAALLLLVCLLPWIVSNIYWRHIFILIAIMILATSSMRAIYLTGEVSLGTAGFMLLGGYSSALFSAKPGLSPWITMPIQRISKSRARWRAPWHPSHFLRVSPTSCSSGRNIPRATPFPGPPGRRFPGNNSR